MENEVIKSLLEEKTKLEQEFNELDAQERNIAVGKERIRGAYIVIVDQLKKFGVIKDEAQQEQPKQTAEKPAETKQKAEVKPKTQKKVVEMKPEQPKEEKKAEEKKVDEKKEKVVAGLTPEEIKKINEAVTKPGVKDDNGNEIPEYLQPEYNK